MELITAIPSKIALACLLSRFSSKKAIDGIEELQEHLINIKVRIDDVAMSNSLEQEWKQKLTSRESKIQEYKFSLMKIQNLRGFAICSGAYSRSRLRREVTKEVNEMKKLIDQFNNTVHQPSPDVILPIRVTALGIEKRLEELQHCLRDEQLHTIGIWGSGGVGKTTILKALNNKFLSGNHGFHVVIYASVSQDTNIERLQTMIAKRLGLPWQKKERKETRAVYISMALKKKRFVLLLDDIGKPLDLEYIGIPLPNRENKCKVVFTTRLEAVCKNMGANKTFKVDPLKTEDAWQLFGRYAGDMASQPEIIDTAKDLVNECDGFPLALLTMGRSMAAVTSREEWTDSLATLKKLKQEINDAEVELPLGIEQTLLSQLKFSYQKLNTSQLKSCISYCSLYPKNHSINKEKLIQYWIGEGFITDFKTIDEAHKTGNTLIAVLKASGMLEDGDDPDSEVKMHDILRTLLINENGFLVQAGMGLTEVPTNVQVCQRVEKVSLMYNDIEALDKLPQFPMLKTLILKWKPYFKDVPSDLFVLNSALKLLDLSHTGIRNIPNVGLGNLVHLRHLDLSFTKIKFLPKVVGELVNLMQLLLEGTSSMETIPRGVVSKLTKLTSLNLYDSYRDWEVNDSVNEGSSEELGDAASVKELDCLKCLSDLGITFSNTQSFESFSSSDALIKSTRCLMVKGCEDLKSAHLTSSFQRLRLVKISDCSKLKEINIGDARDEQGGWKGQLACLEVLHLKALYQAKIIWVKVRPHDFLPMLRELDISFCHELTDISWVLQLVQLEHMNVDTCRKIEKVIGSSEDEVKKWSNGLQKLRILTLRNLPRLNSICDHPLSLPSLEYVKVLQCPQLRHLPLVTKSAIPGVIQGEKEWWNALEWKDDAANKYASFWYFQAAY